MVTTIALPNGRDLGGTALAGPTMLRPGLLLRSAAPASPNSRAEVKALGIRCVVDLRTDAERAAQPNLLPEHVTTVVADVLADAPYDGAANLGKLAAGALGDQPTSDALPDLDLRAIMLQSYRDFALLPSGRSAAGTVLRLLANADSGPVLIHCTAGKDRTGWMIALVLQILGASEADITTDYLASGPPVAALFRQLTDSLAEPQRAREALAPVLGVERAYLDAALQAAEERYGSFTAYVQDGLGVGARTLADLRARLSEPAGQSTSASALM